jgi:hypothetical protein
MVIDFPEERAAPKYCCCLQISTAEDYVRNEMKRMQFVKWIEHVQDRPKWKVIVEKAKTVPEL